MSPGVTLPACPKCQAHLGPDVFNLGGFTPCPNCGTLLRMDVFPALFRPVASGASGEAVVAQGEATCFYHEGKRAAVVCDACGRFLCALCDCQFNNKHYCPQCLEVGGKKKTIEQLETMRMLYSRQALVLSILPLFITGLAALFIAIRHWKSPLSLVSPQRWQMPVALVLATLQTLAFTALIISALVR